MFVWLRLVGKEEILLTGRVKLVFADTSSNFIPAGYNGGKNCHICDI
jgi:hypothetical protein